MTSDYDKVSNEPASSSHASRQGRAELRSNCNNTMLDYMSTDPMRSIVNFAHKCSMQSSMFPEVTTLRREAAELPACRKVL